MNQLGPYHRVSVPVAVRAKYKKHIIKKLDYSYPLYGFQHLTPGRLKGAKGQGIRFEKVVAKRLDELFPEHLSSLGFKYCDGGDVGICIPDGIIYTEKWVIVLETKLRHTMDAWHHLRRLYAPVVAYAFKKPVRCIEVVKYYDPDIKFPEPFRLYQTPRQMMECDAPLGVLVWGR